MPSERGARVELLQGTLDLIVLRALATMGPQHAYGLAGRLAQVADHPLNLNQGTLYPALVRLDQKGWIKGSWQRTESNLGEPSGERVRVLRAHRGERPEHDQIQGSLQQFDAIASFTSHSSGPRASIAPASLGCQVQRSVAFWVQ